MQGIVGHIRAVVSRILFIGVSAQILLGLFWMLLAFDGRQDFAGSAYAAWLDRSLAGLPYEPVIYLLQLAVAFAAGYGLMEALGVDRPFWKIWGGLALLTYPYAMQCHMAILPDSLAFSCFLLLLAAGLKQKNTIYLFWILSTVFLPEYFYFGAVPVTVFFFLLAKRSGKFKKISLEVLLFAAAAVLAFGVRYLPLQENVGANGGNRNEQEYVQEYSQEFHDSLEAAWFRRTVWSSFYKFYPDMPEELKEAISDEEYTAIKRLPENVAGILQPKAESILGREEAVKWFGEFGTFVFKANIEQISSEIVKDAGGYFLPQVFVGLRLAGKGGASYCARNYEIMRCDHPLLTAHYIDYSIWWFVIGLLCVCFLGLVPGRSAEPGWLGKEQRKESLCIIIAGLLSGLMMVMWYTFRESGLWDPKNALFVGCLWVLLMVRTVQRAAAKRLL